MSMTFRRGRQIVRVTFLAAALSRLTWALPATAQNPHARYGPIPDNVWRYIQGRSWRAELPCAQREELITRRRGVISG